MYVLVNNRNEPRQQIYSSYQIFDRDQPKDNTFTVVVRYTTEINLKSKNKKYTVVVRYTTEINLKTTNIRCCQIYDRNQPKDNKYTVVVR